MVCGIGMLNNVFFFYIVDGMYMNSIDYINFNDIVSIDVLKDVLFVVIYGFCVVNGVIIVIIKEGSNIEGKFIIDLFVNLGILIVSKFFDMLDVKGWVEVIIIVC